MLHSHCAIIPDRAQGRQRSFGEAVRPRASRTTMALGPPRTSRSDTHVANATSPSAQASATRTPRAHVFPSPPPHIAFPSLDRGPWATIRAAIPSRDARNQVDNALRRDGLWTRTQNLLQTRPNRTLLPGAMSCRFHMPRPAELGRKSVKPCLPNPVEDNRPGRGNQPDIAPEIDVRQSLQRCLSAKISANLTMHNFCDAGRPAEAACGRERVHPDSLLTRQPRRAPTLSLAQRLLRSFPRRRGSAQIRTIPTTCWPNLAEMCQSSTNNDR